MSDLIVAGCERPRQKSSRCVLWAAIRADRVHLGLMRIVVLYKTALQGATWAAEGVVMDKEKCDVWSRKAPAGLIVPR